MASPSLPQVAKDRPGLLERITTSFAHQGLSVTEATIKTLPGGIARDTFDVIDAKTGNSVVTRDGCAGIEERLRRDLWLPYPRSNQIRVNVPDRPGLLSEITASLSELNLSIVGAKIQTS